MQLILRFFLVLSLVVSIADTSFASKVSLPFQRGVLQLDGKAQALLQKGRPFLSACGWIVQDINSPAHVVWDRILDYNEYKNRVPDTLESEVHKEEVQPDGRKNLHVRLVAGNKFFKLNFFVKAVHSPQHNVLTWSLDRSQKSDMEESIGTWNVIPHPDDPNKTRVLNNQQISLYSWVPVFVQRAINNSSGKGAAAWLKKHCESQQQHPAVLQPVHA